MPFRYQDNLTVGQLCSFLGCESECVIVCSYKRPSIYVGQTRRHASGASRSTSKALRPHAVLRRKTWHFTKGGQSDKFSQGLNIANLVFFWGTVNPGAQP